LFAVLPAAAADHLLPSSERISFPHNHVQNLTFNVGRGNPGAIGLPFYSDNDP
jgi:hypothetical protein